MTIVIRRLLQLLWDYSVVRCLEIMYWTHSAAWLLYSSIPRKLIIGEKEDISEYLDFRFYNKVWYKDNARISEERLGQLLLYVCTTDDLKGLVDGFNSELSTSIQESALPFIWIDLLSSPSHCIVTSSLASDVRIN